MKPRTINVLNGKVAVGWTPEVVRNGDIIEFRHGAFYIDGVDWGNNQTFLGGRVRFYRLRRVWWAFWDLMFLPLWGTKQ